MSPAEFFLWLAGILGGTGIMMSPVFIVRMVLKHREKLAQLQNKSVGGSPALVEEVAALRHEMEALRETTTRFDMSFDAALSQVENRLHSVEKTGTTNAAYATNPAYGEHETVSLRR